MGNTGGNYHLPATDCSHANQVNEDSEYDSQSDSDPYYSAYSNSDDEQIDASIAALTSDISMKVDQIDECNDLSEQHHISVADIYPDVAEGNDQRSYEDEEFHLDNFYKEYLRREPIKPYPLHHLDVRTLWIPFIEEMLISDDYRRLSKFIIRIKAAADASLDMAPFANCRRTLHVYLDLNTSLITMAQNSIDPGRIVEEPSSISIKISECFLLMGQYQNVCQICKKMDKHSPITPRCSYFQKFFLIWIEALIKLENIDIARKTIEEYFQLTTTQEDRAAVHPFLNQIERIEDEIKRLKDEVVDSDNEYVRDSNYTVMKQQRIKAKKAGDQHKKKKRTRPKSIEEDKTVEFFTMSTSWIGVDSKKSKSVDNILLSNESSNSLNAVESIKKPEGHGISDIESDEEFDKTDRDNWIDNYNSSSEDEKDCENETIDYYEQSVNMYEMDKESKLDEYQLLKNGIILSKNYLEQHSKWRQKRDIFQYEEFYGIEKLKKLCKTNPNKFKMCKVKLEAAHKAVCKNIDSSIEI